MTPSDRGWVDTFLDEPVSFAEAPGAYRFGRSRVVRGRDSGRAYLLRWGLLDAAAERIYYQWAHSRGMAARPVQLVALRPGVQRAVRNLAAVWWTESAVEAETVARAPGSSLHASMHDQTQVEDLARAMALDLLLDNACRFAGWMTEDGRTYRILNHQTLGLGAGPVALLTRCRLLETAGLAPRLDLASVLNDVPDAGKDAFIQEARQLAASPDDEIASLCSLPPDLGIAAFRACIGALGDGPGSRDARKLLLRRGPDFLDNYTLTYASVRRRELGVQLRVCRQA